MYSPSQKAESVASASRSVPTRSEPIGMGRSSKLAADHQVGFDQRADEFEHLFGVAARIHASKRSRDTSIAIDDERRALGDAIAEYSEVASQFALLIR